MLLLELIASRGLTAQCRFESLLVAGDEALVARGVDERIVVSAFPAIVFLLQSVIAAMRAQKYVARQALEHFKTVLVVGGDLRISVVPHQLVARIHIRTANDDDMQ